MMINNNNDGNNNNNDDNNYYKMFVVKDKQTACQEEGFWDNSKKKQTWQAYGDIYSNCFSSSSVFSPSISFRAYQGPRLLYFLKGLGLTLHRC